MKVNELFEAKAVDMLGKKHKDCGGTFQETSQYDDMDGKLHCTKCNKEILRYLTEGRWVKGAGGVPLGKDGKPIAPKQPKKVVAAYSDLYWDQKAQASDDANFLTPAEPIDISDSDEIDKIVKSHFSMKKIDWEMKKRGVKKIEHTTVASRVIRVSYEVGPEDDLGIEQTVQDAEYIIVRRNPKKPKQLEFAGYGMTP